MQTALLVGMCQVVEEGEVCNRPVSSRGWCRRHYRRWRNHGTTESLVPKPLLPGTVFGRLTIVSLHDGKAAGERSRAYLCRCECGTEKVISGHSLTMGRTKSCGCLKAEMDLAKLQNYHSSAAKHPRQIRNPRPRKKVSRQPPPERVYRTPSPAVVTLARSLANREAQIMAAFRSA